MSNEFQVVSPFEPSGDQPEAIKELCEGLKRGERNQVLLGVTGSGKTFTMAKIIETMKKPTLIMAPNKILAAQLYTEMKEFFPYNHVEYFVSYYDYYQPEAYIPKTDTYIEKDSAINEQIDRMMELVDALPTMQQTVLRMRHMQEMTMADIASLIGTSEATVRQSLSRARRSIIEQFKSESK